MKEMSKRAAVAALAGVMAMGMLTGCGEKKLDGTQTVATVNGTEIPMGVLSLMVRQTQAQTEAMYASFMGGSEFAIWDTEAEEGKTYGEQAIEQSLEELELMYLMKEKAADFGVEVTEEDQEAIAEAAAGFMEANTEETIAKLAVTEEQVKTYLELRTYESRMYDPIVADVDTEISEEEAQQSTFDYVSISTADLSEEDIEKKKEDAQKILDTMKEDEEADFNETAQSVSEEYSAVEGTFDTNPPEGEEDTNNSSYPDEVLEVLRSLEDGELHTEIIETDTGLYIVRLNKKIDEEATEEKKDSIIQERKGTLYSDTTDSWKEEAEITEDEDVLKTLTLTDNDKFTIAVQETEESSEEVAQDEVLVPAEEETEETDAEAETEVTEEAETETAEEADAEAETETTEEADAEAETETTEEADAEAETETTEEAE